MNDSKSFRTTRIFTIIPAFARRGIKRIALTGKPNWVKGSPGRLFEIIPAVLHTYAHTFELALRANLILSSK